MRKKKTDEQPTEWVLKRDKRLETLNILESRIHTLRQLFSGVPEEFITGLDALRIALSNENDFWNRHDMLERMDYRSAGLHMTAKTYLNVLELIVGSCPDLFEVLAAKLSEQIDAFTKERRKECARRLPALPAC